MRGNEVTVALQNETMYSDMTKSYYALMQDPINCPEWLGRGIIHLLPKTVETSNAKSYRLITFLTKMYRTLKSIPAERTYITRTERLKKRKLWL